MKQLVINADDLGMAICVNEAVEKAHREGIVSSASLLANGPALKHALDHVVHPHPRLGTGVHLCLTSGRPLSPPDEVPDLVGKDGRFRHGFVSLLAACSVSPERLMPQIEGEFERQVDHLKQLGLNVDHLNAHRHIQVIPLIRQAMLEVARRHRIPVTRVPYEPCRLRDLASSFRRPVTLLRNMPKRTVLATLLRRDRKESLWPVYGILDSGAISEASLMSIVSRIRSSRAEIVVHPATRPAEPLDADLAKGDRAFLASAARQEELRALQSPRVRDAVVASGFQIVSFGSVEPTPCGLTPSVGSRLLRAHARS